MIIPTGKEKLTFMRRLFGRVAMYYDMMNRIMTLGQDLRWRREAVQILDIKPEQRILDDGAGTGDISLEIKRRYPGTKLVSCDLTSEMIRIGRKRHGGDQLDWVIADAQNLPFQSNIFDGVISAYLLRNVPDVTSTLLEQNRVMRNGARVVSLETSPPQAGLFQPLIQFYLRVIIPLLGKILINEAESYVYLPQSTEQFLNAEQLRDLMDTVGFKQVRFERRMFGTMAIHEGLKI